MSTAAFFVTAAAVLFVLLVALVVAVATLEKIHRGEAPRAPVRREAKREDDPTPSRRVPEGGRRLP